MVEKQSMKKPDFLRVFFTFVEEVRLYTLKKKASSAERLT